MPATVVSATIGTIMIVRETPATPATGLSTVAETDDFRVVIDLLAAGTPAATHFIALPELTIGGGGTTDIDLTNAQGTDGNVNCNGKKLMAIVIDARESANDVTFTSTGPSNAYTVTPYTVKAGALAILMPLGTGIAVDGTHFNVRFSGTAADVVSVGMLFG